MLILAGVQFGFLVGSYGVGLFLPQILKLGNLSDLRGRLRVQRLLRRGDGRHDCLGRAGGQARREDRQSGVGLSDVGRRFLWRDRLDRISGCRSRL